MIKNLKYPVVAIVVFIWIGFVSSISFMEAWLKFRAAYVTLPIGLSIGKLIFSALNKSEWIFASIIILYTSLKPNKKLLSHLILFAIPISILMVQTFWLLPVLSERAEMIIAGNELPPTVIHFYYLAVEIAKVFFLFIFGITALKFNETGLRNEKLNIGTN